MKRQFLFRIGIIAAASVAGVTALAQNAPDKDKVVIESNRMVITTNGAPQTEGGAVVTGRGDNTFFFVSSEFSFDSKVVKGAPYSAEAVTETVQTLADGNRIVRKTTSSVYRDSEGRTRREQTVPAIGVFVPSADAPVTVFINDPVSKTSYMLDPRSKTARKMPLPSLDMLRPGENFRIMTPAGGTPVRTSRGVAAVSTVGGGAAASTSDGRSVQFSRVETDNVGGTRVTTGRQAAKVEKLGTQEIEGVQAEGTRTTMTIPAGQIGNERPIDVINERWYSSELQTVVLSKRIDPLSGDMTYRLTNLNRSEPASSLFEIPGDYKIQEGPALREFHFSTGDNNKKPQQ